MFLGGRSFVSEYGVLLEFVELFKRLSKVYEIDLTYKVTGWLPDFKGDIELMNGEIVMIEEKLRQAIYEKHNVAFLIEIFIEDMLTDLEKIKPSHEGRAGRYSVEIEKVLGAEFGSDELDL